MKKILCILLLVLVSCTPVIVTVEITETPIPTLTEIPPTLTQTATQGEIPTITPTYRNTPTLLPPNPTPTPCAYGVIIDRLVSTLEILKFRTEPRISNETWTGKTIPELEILEAGCYYVQDDTTEWVAVFYQDQWGWIIYTYDQDGDGLGELMVAFYD